MLVTIQQNVKPDPSKSCGPYRPETNFNRRDRNDPEHQNIFSDKNHDTIGMVAIDTAGRIAAGTSTNGAKSKIPG
jgi:isoaspartyl peptidase/L-asparaginase-like protein (Ntn-hydrolase superfamily)